jgi:hypothetical protein
MHAFDILFSVVIETLNMTVRFTETPVPDVETSYMCMIFDLPSDRDYHLMAYEPVIDNEHVMHHILLYGCDPNGMYKQLTLLSNYYYQIQCILINCFIHNTIQIRIYLPREVYPSGLSSFLRSTCCHFQLMFSELKKKTTQYKQIT